MKKHRLTTPLEERIINKITGKDFGFSDKFINLSQMILRRIARRSERITNNKMIKTDLMNGFKREDYSHLC